MLCKNCPENIRSECDENPKFVCPVFLEEDNKPVEYEISPGKILTKITVTTEYKSGEKVTEEIDLHEKFLADLIPALRNGKSLVDALAFLADVGYDSDMNVQFLIARRNRLGF